MRRRYLAPSPLFAPADADSQLDFREEPNSFGERERAKGRVGGRCAIGVIADRVMARPRSDFFAPVGVGHRSPIAAAIFQTAPWAHGQGRPWG